MMFAGSGRKGSFMIIIALTPHWCHYIGTGDFDAAGIFAVSLQFKAMLFD